MYALVDANNFYVSCERLFRPELNSRPVVVLSNNDGCAISRSNEAKALGIKMGVPYFQIKALVAQHHIAKHQNDHDRQASSHDDFETFTVEIKKLVHERCGDC